MVSGRISSFNGKIISQRLHLVIKSNLEASRTCRHQSSSARSSHTPLQHIKSVRSTKSIKKITDINSGTRVVSRGGTDAKGDNEGKLLNQMFEVRRETLDWFAREYRLRNVMKTVERRENYNQSVSSNTSSNGQSEKDLNKEISRQMKKYRGFSSKDITRVPSRILYCETWFSTLDKSDFEQMIPNSNAMLGDWNLEDGGIKFEVIRNRAAKDLSALKGYFLIFETTEMANIFLYETIGSEISGTQATFHFIDAELPELEPKIIGEGNALLGIQRNQCALLSNVSDVLTKADVLKYLWNYKLIHDDNLSVVLVNAEKSEAESTSVTTNRWLLRFENSYEPHRLWKQQNGKSWTSCGTPIVVELLD